MKIKYTITSADQTNEKSQIILNSTGANANKSFEKPVSAGHLTLITFSSERGVIGALTSKETLSDMPIFPNGTTGDEWTGRYFHRFLNIQREVSSRSLTFEQTSTGFMIDPRHP